MQIIGIYSRIKENLTAERIEFLKANLFIPVFGIPFALYSAQQHSLGIDFSFKYLVYYFLLFGSVVGFTYFYGAGTLIKLMGRFVKRKNSLGTIVIELFKSSTLISLCIYTWVVRYYTYILSTYSGHDVFLNQAIETKYPYSTILLSMNYIEAFIVVSIFVFTIYKLSKVMSISIVKSLVCWIIAVPVFIIPLIYINKACIYIINQMI